MASVPAIPVSWQGWSRVGSARQAGVGQAWPGLGVAWNPSKFAWVGQARFGRVWSGLVRCGKARPDRLGAVRQRMAGHVLVRPVGQGVWKASQVESGKGLVWPGRYGKDGKVRLSSERLGPSWLGLAGKDRTGIAGPGWSRYVKVGVVCQGRSMRNGRTDRCE
jgi:hypothetical protein